MLRFAFPTVKHVGLIQAVSSQQTWGIHPMLFQCWPAFFESTTQGESDTHNPSVTKRLTVSCCTITSEIRWLNVDNIAV